MSSVSALVVLAVAALLEAGGDALVRSGLHAHALGQRAALFAAGGLVLLAYGLVVNAPGWDFGRLLGVYLSVFFVAAQAINLVAFGVLPGLPVLVGGSLIVSGSLLMTFWS